MVHSALLGMIKCDHQMWPQNKAKIATKALLVICLLTWDGWQPYYMSLLHECPRSAFPQNCGGWSRLWGEAKGAIQRLPGEKTNKLQCPRLPRARISLSAWIMIGRGLCYTSSCFCLSPRLTNLNISHFSGIILGPGNRTLFIERVTEEDEGVYHCKATNLKGTVESSAYLMVQGKQLLQKTTRNHSDIYFPDLFNFPPPGLLPKL